MWARAAVLLQHDETDCGPAVLATVARHYKHPVPIARIREMAATDPSGTSLYGLAVAADRLGFRTTGLMAPYESPVSQQVACPVIASGTNDRGMPDFVVVWRATARKVVVGDPAAGVQKWSREKFLERWRGPSMDEMDADGSGALLIVIPSPKLEKIKDRSRVK